MSAAEALVIVVLVGTGTYLSRSAMILLLAGRQLPERVLRALRQVGPAVLAALVVTFVADPDEANRGISAAETAALAASAAVHFKRNNLLLTLLVGMATFWIVRALT